MVTTLAEILPHAARRHKDRIAVIVEDRQFSFTQLDSMSNQVANGLVASGINPGDRVGLYGPNSWEWLVCYYGIVKTGAVANPLNTMLTPHEVRYSVTDAGARAVLASSDKAGTTLVLKGTGNLTDVVLWGEARIEGARMLGDWLQHASTDFSAPQRQPSDLAVICYTSGTTGYPKGAMQSHRSVVGAAVGTALMAARTAGDRIVSALPLSHVYGSCVFNAAMMAGSTLIVIPRFNEVIVATAALQLIPGGRPEMGRKPQVLADSAYIIFNRDSRNFSGNFCIDEEVLASEGITDLDGYAFVPGAKKLLTDLFLD